VDGFFTDIGKTWKKFLLRIARGGSAKNPQKRLSYFIPKEIQKNRRKAPKRP
jgi:hypothetical protein